MDTGSSVSSEKTASEQVAQNPIPRIVAGSTLLSVSACLTQVEMELQMSDVDCSCAS